MYMNGWYMNGMNGWFLGGMWLYWIAAIALIFLLAVFIAKAVQRPNCEARSAESVLKERYARGEITKEEYDQVASDIRR